MTRKITIDLKEKAMIKVRLKRTGRGIYVDSYNLDKHFMNGSVVRMPKKGEHVMFYFSHLDEGWWMTTRIISIVRRKGLIIFNTKNSRYHMKKGWIK